jgi:hypothetical protein
VAHVFGGLSSGFAFYAATEGNTECQYSLSDFFGYFIGEAQA